MTDQGLTPTETFFLNQRLKDFYESEPTEETPGQCSAMQVIADVLGDEVSRQWDYILPNRMSRCTSLAIASIEPWLPRSIVQSEA